MASSTSTSTAAQVLLTVAAVCFVLSELGIRVRSATRRGGSRADHGSVVAVVVAMAAGVLAAAWAAHALPAAAIGSTTTTTGAGVALMGLGIALRQWAARTLGRFFTVVVRVAADQTVVEDGPYRWVRHPSYTGLLLTLLGLGVALGNWVSVLALVVLPALGLVVRIRVEERELLSGLGEAYGQYCERRRRLVPGIW